MKRKTVFTIVLLLALAISVCAAAAVPSPSAVLALKDATKAKTLSVTPSVLTLRLGNNGTGEAVTVKAAAKPLTASQEFDWTSLNEAVATVDENGAITPRSLGKAKIVCSTKDLSNLKKVVTVYVKPLKVKSVTLDQTAITVAPNTSARLNATLTPANAYDTGVKWTSSNTNVATVDANGLVTAKKLGSCVITCKSLSSGVTAKARVTATRAASDVYYLAIGQQNYVNASKLIGCKMDADRVAATIEASTFGGSSKPNGTVLYDQTGAQMKSAFKELASWGMDDNDVTYVYYSGHGSNFTGYEGAIIGVDYVSASSISTTGVTVPEIRSYLDNVPGTVIIIVDACHSGNFITAKSVGGGDFVQAFVNAFSSNRGAKSIISENELKDKYKLLVACRPEEQSYMIGNSFGSVFTRYITQSGGVWGADTGVITVKSKMAGDTNGDKAVSLKEIFSYSYSRTANFIKKKFKNSVTQRMMVWPTADAYPVFARLS